MLYSQESLLLVTGCRTTPADVLADTNATVGLSDEEDVHNFGIDAGRCPPECVRKHGSVVPDVCGSEQFLVSHTHRNASVF